jgi:hypothetical protein
LCLTETWQKPGDNYVIKSFSCVDVYAKKPRGSKGRYSGGVCKMVKTCVMLQKPTQKCFGKKK